MTTPDSEPVVLPVSHSTRPLAEFIALLKAHSVIRLTDTVHIHTGEPTA